MRNVLIVEDEVLVRIGLKNSVSWDKLGLNVIADVSNGEEGWEAFERQRPDIVITDIKMPVMDGIELIKRIRTNDARTKIVILTCLQEFDLARTAVTLGVSDYILKLHMSIDMMENVLGKVCREMDEQAPPPLSSNLIVEQAVMKETLINKFLFQRGYSESEFAGLAEQVGLRLQPRRMIAAAMQIINSRHMMDRLKDDKGQLMRMTVLNMVREVLNDFGRGEAITDEDDKFLLLFSFHDMVSEQKMLEELQQIVQHIRKALMKYFNVRAAFGISGFYNQYAEMGGKYREATEALETSRFLGIDTVYRWHMQDRVYVRRETERKLRTLLQRCSGLSEWLQLEARKNVEEWLQQDNCGTPRDTRKRFMQWIHSPMASFRRANEEALALIMSYGERVSGAQSLDELTEMYFEYLSVLGRLLRKQRTIGAEVAKTIQYIEEHYHEQISLQKLADMAQMSPNYLCAVFKKEMKQNIYAYLTHVRMETAKELMYGSDLKLYEISEKVGFSDHGHFSRTFKKHTGLSPREYCKQWRDSEEG